MPTSMRSPSSGGGGIGGGGGSGGIIKPLNYDEMFRQVSTIFNGITYNVIKQLRVFWQVPFPKAGLDSLVIVIGNNLAKVIFFYF